MLLFETRPHNVDQTGFESTEMCSSVDYRELGLKVTAPPQTRFPVRGLLFSFDGKIQGQHLPSSILSREERERGCWKILRKDEGGKGNMRSLGLNQFLQWTSGARRKEGFQIDPFAQLSCFP